MSAEGLREAAILVLVFGLLDKFLSSGGPSLPWTGAVFVVALLSFAAVGMLERSRRP
jgi:hypothetical protein